MTSRKRILLVDDHVEMAKVLAESLADEGYDTVVTDSGAAALAEMERTSFDVVITDLMMPGIDGLEVLRAARVETPAPAVVVMTAFGSIDNAVEAMQLGAAHYLVKPCSLRAVSVVLERIIDEQQLRADHQRLRAQSDQHTAAARLLGQSPTMTALRERIARVALSNAPVLIHAESGTGKELVARALHEDGSRKNRPFVAVNCTALPEQLLESELFGHVRGAFTGATAARKGLFVEADRGTLFLDEIGDMPLATQAKLLRAVEQGEIRPVGSEQPRQVDVRIIAATHRDLKALAASGGFRNDLLYRLDVVPLTIPPLRERRADVPLLIGHFLNRARQRNPSAVVERLTAEAVAVLTDEPWPGNVRQLENFIERLVVVAPGPEIGTSELSELGGLQRRTIDVLENARRDLPTLRELEAQYIEWVLQRFAGNKTRAAETLGIDVSTLHRRRNREPELK